MIVLGVVALAGVVAFGTTLALVRRRPRVDPGAPTGGTRAVAERVRDVERSRVGAFTRRRLDPTTTTGLALTVGLGALLLAGAVLAVLAAVIRSSGLLVRADRGLATWADTHGTAGSTRILVWSSALGSTMAIVVASVALVSLARGRRRGAVALYLAVLVGGQNLAANGLKALVDRARPLHALTGFSGSSFPSGHATAAFACFGAFALVVGLGRGTTTRTVLSSVAAGLAAVVGVSRVLLGVHFLTDVVAGAVLGAAWFTAVTVAFGGRLLRFGAPVAAGERAERLEEVTAGAAGAPGADAGRRLPAVVTGNTPATWGRHRRQEHPVSDRDGTEPEERDTDESGDDERSGARGIAISKLTAEDVGKPELADHEPAGTNPKA